jgi:hypothetical protein
VPRVARLAGLGHITSAQTAASAGARIGEKNLKAGVRGCAKSFRFLLVSPILEVRSVLYEKRIEFIGGINPFFDQQGVHRVDGRTK